MMMCNESGLDTILLLSSFNHYVLLQQVNPFTPTGLYRDMFTSSADPEVRAHNEPSYQGLHCFANSFQI